MRNHLLRALRLICLLVLVPSFAQGQQTAQPAADDSAALAKKLANPISDLVSLPMQFNWEQNVGPSKQTRFVLSIQPVMPFALSQDWNLIMRVIVPLVSQPPLFDGGMPAFGVGDIFASFFFSPSSGGVTWGVGPAISLPSTTIPTLGTEKWSAGPTVVVLKQTGPWTTAHSSIRSGRFPATRTAPTSITGAPCCGPVAESAWSNHHLAPAPALTGA